MKNLKQIRLNNGWTQQYVANYLCITKAAYSNIETGKRNPSLDLALRIQKMFDTPIEYLLEDKKQ